MSISAPGIVNLWETIKSYGIDPAPLFAAAHVSFQPPIDPSIRIPYEKTDRIWAQAIEMSGDESIALRSATLYSLSQLGALGYAWQASSSLRSALLRLERFIRVINDDAKVHIEEKNECLVVAPKINQSGEPRAKRDENALALITQMCRMIYGKEFQLNAVNFAHKEPQDMKPYVKFFGCELNFNQTENQLFIPLWMVDKTLVGADPEMALLSDQVITRRLAQIDKNDIVARVQAVFVDQLSLGNVSDDSVAEALHMSPSTLHRKLAGENTNFRSVLVETRRKLASQYILDSSLTLTEISMLLGFSESSSFSRAFKTWTGSSPTEVRQARVH